MFEHFDVQELIQIRRELHKIPELGYQEFKTGEFIANRLNEYGLEVKKNIAKTGLLGLIRTDGAKKTLLLRADMDALELQEEHNLSYQSQHCGMMHACGHDVHMAILLGVAKYLMKKNRDKLKVNVKFMFQPGEEGFGGALPMIQEGILENPKVDAALAYHVVPDVEVGKLLLTKGAVTSSPDNFEITIKGRGGHGAMPEQNIDSILIGSMIVSKLKTLVHDYIDPKYHAVVTVCSFISGTNYNVMPDNAILKGTFRTFEEATRQRVAQLIEKIATETAESYGANCDVRFEFLYPSVVNDDHLLCDVADIAKETADVLWTDVPQMWGEDFSYLSRAVPSCLMLLGCGNKNKGITAPLHNSKFAVDEMCIPIGVKILSDFALHFD